MTIVFNGATYDITSWNENGFTMESDMTLSEIEEAFSPQEGAQIIVKDGDQEVGRYYNKAIESMSISGMSPRTVVVTLDLTQITENAEDRINGLIEDSDVAIVELAEIVGELAELDMPSMSDELRSHQETLNTWFSHAQEIIDFHNDLRKEGGILDMLDARITALEHEIGIRSIEMNTSDGGESNG